MSANGKLAFLYAGQGSQKKGMGQDLYNEYQAFKNVIDTIALDFDIKSLMFEDAEGLLNITRYTQPAMAAFAAGVTDILRENGINPDYCAGLSLGEYSALYCAGVFDRDTFIDLVAFRGRVMDDAAKGLECKMSAVLGMESADVADVCSRVCESGEYGYVTVSNYNCKGQYVICGDVEAVAKAEELLKERGAKRCVPLKVSGPFHTKFMQPAADALKEKFAGIKFNEMQFPVLFNTTADEIKEDETIPELLEKQVRSSIYMEDTILNLERLGVTKIIEIGPGKALSGFVKKTAPSIETYSIEDVDGLRKVLADFKK